MSLVSYNADENALNRHRPNFLINVIPLSQARRNPDNRQTAETLTKDETVDHHEMVETQHYDILMRLIYQNMFVIL